MGPQETDDDEEGLVGKKAKAAFAENGAKRKEVKSEPLADDGQVSEAEAEVSFF